MKKQRKTNPEGTLRRRFHWREHLPEILAIVISLVLCVGLYLYATTGRSTYDEDGDGTIYALARVLEVVEDDTVIDEDTENVRRGTEDLEVRILTGRYKGEEASTTSYLSAYYNVYVQEGDKIAVSITTTGDSYTVSVYNYSRDLWIWAFIAIFAAILILVGGKHGVKALVSLAITVVCVIFLLIPLMVQKGWPAIPTTLAICAYTIFITFVILGGIHTKTMVAALGSFFGVVTAGLLAWGSCKIVHISGMNMDEAESLLLTAVDNGLKIKGLLICGILIAAEGAVMDIAMSISSAVCEIHDVNPELNAKQLFRSGMNIGRDAMGTMANTLVLAFAGSSLNMMIFIYSYNVSYIQLMNTDFVAIEVIRSLSGCIGIVLSVPIVAFLCATILGRQKGSVRKAESEPAGAAASAGAAETAAGAAVQAAGVRPAVEAAKEKKPAQSRQKNSQKKKSSSKGSSRKKKKK